MSVHRTQLLTAMTAHLGVRMGCRAKLGVRKGCGEEPDPAPGNRPSRARCVVVGAWLREVGELALLPRSGDCVRAASGRNSTRVDRPVSCRYQAGLSVGRKADVDRQLGQASGSPEDRFDIQRDEEQRARPPVSDEVVDV